MLGKVRRKVIFIVGGRNHQRNLVCSCVVAAGATGAFAKPQDVLDLFTEYDIERYRLQRRLEGPIYSAAGVKKYETLMDQAIQLFMSRMKELEGQILDLEEWTMALAFGRYPDEHFQIEIISSS